MVSEKEVILRLILSAVLSGFVGLEREMRHRGAGLRTHILVSLGSSLIMLTSLYIFDIYKDSVPLDPTRIAAGVITGIGFLCAGTIIRYGEAVKGLTTAASLWMVASIGLSVGCGFYQAGYVACALTLIVLLVLRPVEKYVFKKGT